MKWDWLEVTQRVLVALLAAGFVVLLVLSFT